MSENIQNNSELRKLVNDPIHGHIELHPLCVKIIDTPQFQRLRHIKQTDAVYFVYPGATHNRFEHSIGVCHLAENFVRSLQTRQPELGITDVDVNCVMIAGLLHDIGHGPMSHLFERFLAKVLPKRKWTHEEASVRMFNHLLDEKGFRKIFEDHGLSKRDIQFIEEQIRGDVAEYKGRDRDKQFLYEIVNNRRNGIDVDKWDYFARDCYMLGIPKTFDHIRCMRMSRVIEVDGVKQICFRDKEVDHIYDMFLQRAKLHSQAYQHKTVYIIGEMLIEALEKANAIIKISGKHMTETIDDMAAFTQLTDNVIHQITYSEEASLKASREILEKIMFRKMYKFVTEKHPNHPTYKYLRGNENILAKKITKDVAGITKDDIVIQIVHLDLGSEFKNPLEKVRFFSKYKRTEAVCIKESVMQAKHNLELLIRVFSKKGDDERFNKKVENTFLEKIDIALREMTPPVEVAGNGAEP
ncbi:deoxynucleoside triphosphate triphosphohydrolase SAMHD1-like [Dreissena polymorpha]|uniref:deoxynucleoside triphosphate triphosphohydrolase SAMHD1-like n=1 Tax=Dreissena polymorpha TaxID=45954 RepID=UPI0022642AA7|nr:deoxynucleoside triphosphate triphosphohydrolase SAMHD1-like [Dreissena polymorpha]